MSLFTSRNSLMVQKQRQFFYNGIKLWIEQRNPTSKMVLCWLRIDCATVEPFDALSKNFLRTCGVPECVAFYHPLSVPVPFKLIFDCMKLTVNSYRSYGCPNNLVSITPLIGICSTFFWYFTGAVSVFMVMLESHVYHQNRNELWK